MSVAKVSLSLGPMGDITNVVDSPGSSLFTISSNNSPYTSSPLAPKRKLQQANNQCPRRPHYNQNVYMNKSRRSAPSYLNCGLFEQSSKVKQFRLDMLDHSHFTSFPLVPPAQKKHEKVVETIVSLDNAQGVTITADISGQESDFMDSESDPIVLVEDYIKSKQLKRKKLSVADLKESLKYFDVESSFETDETTGSPSYLNRVKTILSNTSSSLREAKANSPNFRTSSSTLLTKCIVEEDEEGDEASVSTPFNNVKTSQSLFSSVSTLSSDSNTTLKLSSEPLNQSNVEFTTNKRPLSLKYCVICETPLYDLSSHLPADQNFNEFVCSCCTEKYELLSKLLDDFDQSIQDLLPIPDDIEDIEEAITQQPALKRQKNTSNTFSITLINKLQGHLRAGEDKKSTTNASNTKNDRKSALWLLHAKKKLRWRWRISGLLPEFLSNDNCTLKN